MSNQLITIVASKISNQEVQAVNARDLHEFLEVKTSFNDWILRRIQEYSFVENEDFYSFLSKTPIGGRPTKEYHIVIDMAKELSMVERNEKGKLARKYFIECEKQVKQARQEPDPVLHSKPAHSLTRLETAVRNFESLKAFSNSIGLQGNQAILSANRGVRKHSGMDLLELTDNQKLLADIGAPSYTATHIGEQMAKKLCERHNVEGLKVSGQAINKCLEHYKYIKNTGQKNQPWEITDLGIPHMKLTEAEINGKGRRNVEFYQSVIPVIEKLSIEKFISKRDQKRLTV